MAAGAALAGALLASLARDGIEPEPALRLLRWRPRPGAEPVAGPADLGRLHESLASAPDRRRRGAWYTPDALATEVVALALPTPSHADLGPVVDPACGGGAFLLAAADRLRVLGLDPSEVLGRLRGRDVDPLAVAVTEAALWWWAARLSLRAVPAGIEVGDSLLDVGPPAGTVVGNPPFLSQLREATAVDADRREALRRRWGDAVRAYTDPAWLFGLQGVEAVAAGGRVALVLPRSFLAARDAAAVRDRIDARARLVTTLVPDRAGFDADVHVCVPVLERCDGGDADAANAANDWSAAVADAAGVPAVDLAPSSVLGDVADTHAGFRDEFYGMAAGVAEGGHGRRLVTAGAIDPLRLLDRAQRFDGRRWDDPRVDVTRLDGRAARWAAIQAGPKVLVATQTRVLEVVADPEGELVGSVPVVVVRPRDPARVWHLAAAITAPSASAWLLRRAAGTGRSPDACRPTAALLAALPLPVDAGAWDRAAALAERAQAGQVPVADIARAAELAYGSRRADVVVWWEQRRPQR